MDTQIEDEPISSQFIREYYQWDRMSDVKWDILRNNLASAKRILANPEKFPNADFDGVEHRATELSLFLTTNLR
jgi:hypothetical protein